MEEILALITGAEALEPEALMAYNALKSAIATPFGQQIVGWMKALYTHTSTPGSAVIVEPVTTLPAAATVTAATTAAAS